jgi:PKD repeat protein
VGGSLDGNIGQFTTAPVEGSIKSFTFAFASCSNDSTTTAFDNAVNFGPRFFLHTGDFHYADITDTSQSTKRVAMENKISGNAGLKTMLAKLPTAYIWSDHDSGNNDNTGSQTYRATYQSMYRQVVPNAKLVDGSGIYHSFVYGRIRFIMCDTRSFTSPATDTDNSSKTLLGTTQKTWVKDRLADPEPVKILVVDQPWIGTGSNDDKWWSYSTERTELANYIEKIGAKVLILHGDAHELSADDGTNNKYDTGNNYPIPQVCAAPMGQNASHKGGPYSQGVYPSNTNVTHQYGRMTITDSGAYIKLVFSGRDASNAEQVALTVNWHLPNRGVGVATGIGSGTAPSPPNPTFSLSPSTITVPASVQFTDTTSPTPVSWLWDFKDGTSSTAQFPAHTYTVAGTYNPRLTVVGANGLSAFVEHTLTANNPAGPTAPVASFTPSNTSVNQGVTVAFTNTSTGTSPTWAWTFGQGEGSSTAQNPTHLYNTPGSYTVTLTATNGAGTSSASTVINVTVPGPVGSALMYRPPGYPAYAGYQIVDITQANRKPALNATVDYIIRLPQTPIGWVNGVEISGGRNIVMIGGEFNMTKDWATSGNDEGKSNRALYFTSTGGSGNRTIHVEGIHIAGNWAFEGININLTSAADQSGTTMNFVNHRHDICRSNRGTVAPPHYGGDVMQIFIGTGPKTLNIDHLTVGVSDYQAFWWQSQDAAQVRNLSNININGNGAGGPNPSNGTVPTTATDLWTGHTILLNEDSATLNVSNVFVYAPVRSVGQTITNQSGNQFTPKIGNGVTFSSSVKHADFVTTNDCGLGYRSPGYL